VLTTSLGLRGTTGLRFAGVAINPLENPHGGANHRYIGHASTVRRDAVSICVVMFQLELNVA